MKQAKIGLGVLLVLAVLYVGLSWFIGMRAQSVLTQAVEQTNQNIRQSFGALPNQPHATISDYQRGVFSSQVQYTIDLGALVDTPQATVQIQAELQHGLFPADLIRAGEFKPHMLYANVWLLPTPFTQPWFDLVGEQNPQAQVRIDLTQNGSVDLALAPINLKIDEDELRFSGGQVHLALRNGFTDSDSSASFASLDVFESGQERVRIRDIRLTGQSHQNDNVIQSDGHMDVASLTVRLPAAGAVQIDNFGIDFAYEQAATLADYRFVYRLGNTHVGERDFGAFDLGLGFKRIDLPALMGLAQALEQTEIGDMMTHAGALLKAQPTISLEPLRWKTEKGESRANMTVDLFADEEGLDVSLLLDDLGFLHYLRQIKLDIDVSRAMVLQVAGLIAAEDNPLAQGFFAMMFDQYASKLESVGLVRVDGDKVSLQAEYRYEDETVNLNGKPMPLMEFVMLVAQMF